MISILAGAAALPLIGQGARASTYQWSGVALGANANIVLDHEDAKALTQKALLEIARLEKVFSLYQPESQLSLLNRDGVLSDPAVELIELLDISGRIHDETNGVFDPTIQPLWALYAERFAAGKTPALEEILEVRAQIGWHNLTFNSSQISFKKTNMGLTLNGIAQGYVADKVANLLRQEGVSNVLVNTGEISAQGVAPNGTPWPVSLPYINQSIDLSNVAIATSSPTGTAFDQHNNVGHILDPHSGHAGGKWQNISVIDKSAARADGLSTAFCLMTKPQIDAVNGDHRVVYGDALQS
jgi:thiamine biosynthesis lipoprotein